MAISDFLSLTDDSLTSAYSAPAFDRDKARKNLSDRLTKAVEQFSATEPQKGRKMFSVNNSIVKLSLPIAIEGKSEFLIPSERFPDAVKKLKASIDKGDLDDALKAGVASEGSQDGSHTASTGTRKPRAPMSEEAKAAMSAKRAATMAARGIKPGRQPKAAANA